ncbi:MAG: hypothetical protein HF976_11010 [ANME-2 cluster archaeon]|nr:hypothetical protein [ANME-2 cluster archaeon]MBC2701915.1 hypothetical protein [ANME-2 cluster archaeon]MBC2707825.1 hypothetical protein [ANME-2 cluster archaeon]MBC2747856.1 hypothetical protein [ANME-2 cluster archaeon]
MKNKNMLAAVLAAIMVLSIVALVPGALAGNDNKGNGAPSGQHYNLNLIGKDKIDILPNDDNNGHRIFVNLYKRTKISLEEGPFEVIDADGTDGKAVFQLPKPENTYVTDPATGEVTEFVPGAYEVYIRPLGKPGGNGNITTCAFDSEANETVCSTNNVILVREKGKSTFGDVTQELTTITYFDEESGKWITVDIFDESLEGYFWDYDNNGLRLVQLRFYPL